MLFPLLLLSILLSSVESQRTVYNLNPNWRFLALNKTAPAPAPGNCSDPACAPATDDAAWRTVEVPHDAVVEGTFNQFEDASAGFLPLIKGWYRRHITFPDSFFSASAAWLELEAVMQNSSVYLNGALLGRHSSGFTAQRYFLPAAAARQGADNVLAVFFDAAPLDGWWYNGGGIVRGVRLTIVAGPSPAPFLPLWGIYAPSRPTGAIVFSAEGAPFADAEVTPSINVSSFSGGSQPFSIAVSVVAANGKIVAHAEGSGVAPGGGWQRDLASPRPLECSGRFAVAPCRPPPHPRPLHASRNGARQQHTRGRGKRHLWHPFRFL